MEKVNAVVCAALAALVLGGCGAAEDGAGDEHAAGNDAPVQAEVAANTELARVEFADGNVVRFEELYGGVFVSEHGSELNPRHLLPKAGLTALEAFKSLAPGRSVPAALMQMHERMYPPGATLAQTKSTATGATPQTQEPAVDPD